MELAEKKRSKDFQVYGLEDLKKLSYLPPIDDLML